MRPPYEGGSNLAAHSTRESESGLHRYLRISGGQGRLTLGLLHPRRNQALLATHSPILSAIPGGTIYEIGGWGLRRSRWTDLPLVRRWQMFLPEPNTYLHHMNPS